jgi:hypothetical protein
MSLDVMHARVAFRNRAFIDVMDLALRFFAVHARLYAKVSLFALTPCVALTLLAAWAWGWTEAAMVALLLSFVAQVPFTVLASRLVFQEKVAAAAVLRAAAREMPRILVMRLGWALSVATGMLFLFVPGLWLAALFFFVDEVMILERSNIGPAFGRSNRIAMGGIGDALIGVSMTVLLPMLAMLLTDVGGRAFIGELLQFRPPVPAWTAGGSVLATLGWFGIIPYVATARFFTYLNMRTRAEGWDIQTRFAAIAARSQREQEAE